MRVHSRPVEVRYHANAVSCASFCTLLALVAAIVVPYFVAYALGGFWYKEAAVRERPAVRFRHEALAEAHFGESPSIAWSTSAPLNAALGSRFRACELRSWSDDYDRDGRPESFEFALRMPIDRAAGERLLEVSLLVGLEVLFDDGAHAELRLNSSVYAHHASPLPLASWRQHAELTLETASPLPPGSHDRPTACEPAFWMFKDPVQPSGLPATAHSILERYWRCNDTVSLRQQPPLTTSGSVDSFELRLNVTVPNMRVDYVPGVAELLKFAWVQYVAVMLPIAALLGCLHRALIEFSVVAARVHDPLKPHRI